MTPRKKEERLWARFIAGCEKVESLVLDPLPTELFGVLSEKVAVEDDEKSKTKASVSFNAVTDIFPNMTDLYLGNTRFTPRECNRFVDFVQQTKKELRLRRVFYSKTQPIYERDVGKVKLRLKELGWNFIKSQQMIVYAKTV